MTRTLDYAMANPLAIDRVRAFWTDLQRLIADRSAAEERIAEGREAEATAIHQVHDEARNRITAWHDQERSIEDAEFEHARQAIITKSDADLKLVTVQQAKEREQAFEQYQAEEEATHQAYRESRWTHGAVYEADAKKCKSVLDEAKRQIAQRADAAAEIRETAIERHRIWSLAPVDNVEATETTTNQDPLPRMDALLATASEFLRRFEGLWAPRLLMGDRLLWAAFAAWIVIAASGLLMPQWYYGVIAATLIVPVIGVALRYGLAARAKAQATWLGRPIFRAVATIEQLRSTGEKAADNAYEHAIAQSKQHQKDEVRKAEIEHRRRLAESLERRDDAITSSERQARNLSKHVSDERDISLAALVAEYRSRTESVEARVKKEITEADTKFDQDWTAYEIKYAAEEKVLVDAWEHGRARLQYEQKLIDSENDQLFPPWDVIQATHWKPAQSVPAGMRFGAMAVDIAAMAGGQPADSKLKPFAPTAFALPALLPFPHRGSTLLHTNDAGRAAGVQALQSIMLRYMTALPPGKVRFTIVDPVGLGENFASFMHLADYDEQLVTSRIWTEPSQIERRLTDLTAHMENVIQKYLRNQYKSIEDYNAQAGEVAEPYRVLVIANFPTNFTAETARRLVSIANSGANCGVYVLISVESKQLLPQGFDLGDLEHACLNLSWESGRFTWEDADFGPLPLTVDAPPPAADLAKIALKIGEHAKLAGKVEVDFGFIEPSRDQWWGADSRRGLRVPLGRAGATKRQHLQLGVGTAQHALVAGKTGSGKSTLLHALITNLALHYGPDEVELYLIDFKKGVEFKTYATYELPHARVIAVESEREFGLSVLQRLDAELKRRGELFRTAGVQDVAAYRDKTENQNRPEATSVSGSLPRILLVVDEFQEFFVEDDKLSQEAALLLDRLVRQGRAFGLHVLLGSQTLGGAYSLARATIDQMAVRIALQCSEADANLILAKDNNAARLLSRPGEAIYNDANGLVEGNDIFQVVWLPEERREVYLRDLQTLAQQRNWQAPGPTIVFEGNNPADLPSNSELRELIEAGGAELSTRERLAWLGDALAIKDPTAARFRRQSGSNLLIIGQNGDAARAMLGAATVSLLFQQTLEQRVGAPTITILDGSPSDDPEARWLERLAGFFPHDIQMTTLRSSPHGLDRLAEELEARKIDPSATCPPSFLVIYGLHRFRDLRRPEDDFGFGRRDEARTVSPAEQLAELIREGPALGIHVLGWCDTLANVQRAVDRRDLREFEQRVLFQMGVADSSTLIDSPAASRLGLNRALFAAEEMSTPEKFRPYRIPPDTWLSAAAARLIRPPLDATTMAPAAAEK
jgi:energy-coupling factor transporter ATP-binding protein EcfA2